MRTWEMHREIMHRVRLATSGSLGVGSYPCYATRFGEESALFSRDRGRRSGWLESLSWLRLTHRTTRSGFLLPASFLSSSSFFSLLFFFSRGSRAVQGQCTPSRRVSDHCCGNNERWPLLSTVVELYRSLPTYVYYTNSHLQQGL